MKNDFLKWLGHYISPAFLIMLSASFILWYIAKLNYSYTTDLDINIRVADCRFNVKCVVEGVGTNLFGYRLYKGGKVSIPLNELKYSRSADSGLVEIDTQSLQNAISVRYSDIKVISVSNLVPVNISHEAEQKYICR